jgi:hypothetical protein
MPEGGLNQYQWRSNCKISVHSNVALKNKKGIPGPGTYNPMSDLTGSDQKIHVSTFSNIVPFVMESCPRFIERSMF